MTPQEWLETLLQAVHPRGWRREYRFHPFRKWRFDYAVPHLFCANHGFLFPTNDYEKYSFIFPVGAMEIDGGTFMSHRTGHSSGVGLRGWREKNNAAMSLGWRVWHYAPEEVIKSGRKTIPDEPVLKQLPWIKKVNIYGDGRRGRMEVAGDTDAVSNN